MSSPQTQRRRALAASLLAFAALALPACSDPCLQLATQICYCLPDDGTRAACNAEASADEDDFPVGPNDAAYCQALLDSNACDCNLLTTPQGKANCGLVYSTTPGAPQ